MLVGAQRVTVNRTLDEAVFIFVGVGHKNENRIIQQGLITVLFGGKDPPTHPYFKNSDS